MLKKNITELGKTISEAREKLGISQRELARKSNMDCAEVCRIENGKRLKPNIISKSNCRNIRIKLSKTYETCRI